MSSFTKPLIVKKLIDGRWEVAKGFTYHLGYNKSGDVVRVPKGFKTDFASVPRLFWSIIPPDGKYSQAAVLHDYVYQKHTFERKKCDQIFLEAMKVLGVSWWKRRTMYRAVRLFGGIPYGAN